MSEYIDITETTEVEIGLCVDVVNENGDSVEFNVEWETSLRSGNKLVITLEDTGVDGPEAVAEQLKEMTAQYAEELFSNMSKREKRSLVMSLLHHLVPLSTD